MRASARFTDMKKNNVVEAILLRFTRINVRLLQLRSASVMYQSLANVPQSIRQVSKEALAKYM